MRSFSWYVAGMFTPVVVGLASRWAPNRKWGKFLESHPELWDSFHSMK